MKPSFQNLLIWKYCVVFGTLFNDIEIWRGTNVDPQSQRFKVPIEFAPAEKALAMIERKGDDGRIQAIQLPRMSFEMTGLQFDSTRKIERRHTIDKGSKYVLRGAPYNINFQLNILSKNMLDATKIVEQILFMFQPDFTVDVKLLNDFEHIDRISIDIAGVSHQDEFEGDFQSIRRTQWTIDFVLKGWLYGGQEDGKQIKLISLDFNPSMSKVDGSQEKIEHIVGLTPWGTPASDKSESIDYKLIKETDNYGIITTREGL